MTSTSPCGRLSPTRKISESDVARRQIRRARRIDRSGRPRAAATMTTSAPAARSFDASAAIVGAERRDPQSLDVGGERRPQRIDRHHADDADLDAGDLDDDRRPHVRPLDRPARRLVDQVRREKGIRRLGGARLERAAQIARQLPRRRRVDRPEIEIVVADRLRGVAHRVVGVDDERAFAEIRLDVALKRVAGVEQQRPRRRPMPARPAGCSRIRRAAAGRRAPLRGDATP